MASKLSKVELTVDEAIALLSKTSLPTLIVEGRDDVIVYRNLEQQLADLGVSVFPVGGRLKVLEVFRRRAEIKSQVKLAFIADQDTWVVTGVPSQFLDPMMIYTAGYSVENDVYVDGELWKLLSGSEDQKFRSELLAFNQWYALALTRHLADPGNPIALHPDHVLEPIQYATLVALKAGETYPHSLLAQVQSRYELLVRGKSLLGLLLRNIKSPKHSPDALLQSVAIRPGANLNAIATRARQALS